MDVSGFKDWRMSTFPRKNLEEFEQVHAPLHHSLVQQHHLRSFKSGVGRLPGHITTAAGSMNTNLRLILKGGWGAGHCHNNICSGYPLEPNIAGTEGVL